MSPAPRTPWWHPDELARRAGFLRVRGQVLAAVRRFFDERGFVEVDTPALQVSPGLEPHLAAFATELVGPNPDDRRRLYLHTSPEFAMKKLLVAGVPKLFQLAHVFRNGERSATHAPEFTMLEWYRAGAGYRELMADCVGLVRAAARAAGAGGLAWQGRHADPFAEWSELSVAEAFARHADIDLLATAPDPAAPDAGRLACEARRIGVEPHPGDGWEDIFFRVLLERVEPRLGVGAPTFLVDYPVALAALSRPKPDDPRLAERFELYIGGLELANAFGELTDAGVQRARFAADMDRKERLYGVRYPVDEDFLAALACGMPESAGIALGLDRLVMLCAGASSVEDVQWAPVAYP